MLKLMAKCSPAMNTIVQDAKNPFFGAMQGFSFSTEWEEAGALFMCKVEPAMLVLDVQTKLR